MKILESTVQLAATHEAERSQRYEVTSVQSFRQLFDSLAVQGREDEAAARKRVEKLLQSLVDAILAAIDGKKCKENLAAGEPLPVEGLAQAPTGQVREIRWEQTVTESLRESEKTQVCGSGTVRTADGRTLDFAVALNLSREYESKRTQTDAGSIRLRDPLVINFDGKSCELTDRTLCFDLDADGKAEQIPQLGAGSGFLVFDRNGNGKADNGSELFGARSGDGFADLAQLDADHNGWIDEADPVWSQLSVWSGDRLIGLGDRGVGALYTGSVNAPFSLKNADNELLGQIRSAGLYLKETGEVGHLQQVDLAVSGPAAAPHEPEQRQSLQA